MLMTPPMLTLFLAALLSSSKTEIPPDQWDCANTVEVWCAVDGCAAKPDGEMTPMSITAGRDGAFSVCAYTGCWEGETTVAEADGRLLWAGDGSGFSTQPDGGFEADITLLIIEKEGVGFVRAGGIASPLLCTRRPVDRAVGASQ